MDYDKMTIESLAHDCFKRSGYAINKQDLMSRVSFLCEQYHQSKVNKIINRLNYSPCYKFYNYG